jgi:hypothetical protein
VLGQGSFLGNENHELSDGYSKSYAGSVRGFNANRVLTSGLIDDDGEVLNKQ